MQTYFFALQDDENRTFSDVVTAPDRSTALRMFVRSLLETKRTTLAALELDSLASVAREPFLEEDWRATGSIVCCNCTSRNIRPATNEEIAAVGASTERMAGRMQICVTCGFTWLPVEYEPRLREKIEAEAAAIANDLDKYEQWSLEHDGGD